MGEFFCNSCKLTRCYHDVCAWWMCLLASVTMFLSVGASNCITALFFRHISPHLPLCGSIRDIYCIIL